MRNTILREISEENLSNSDERLTIRQALLSKLNLNEDSGDIAELEDIYFRMFYFVKL